LIKKILVVLIGLMLFTVTVCTIKVTTDENTAVTYVKAQGYKITAQKGEVLKYTLEKSKLYGAIDTIYFQEVWGVQMVEPEMYLSKEITVYGFTVKNHPLEKIYKESKGANVFIMLSGGKAIGGYSSPNTDELIIGGAYSLDGKTLEEVTGLSYQQWCENWKRKYAN